MTNSLRELIAECRKSAADNLAWMRDHEHDEAEASEAEALAEAYNEVADKLESFLSSAAKKPIVEALREAVLDIIGAEPIEVNIWKPRLDAALASLPEAGKE